MNRQKGSYFKYYNNKVINQIGAGCEWKILIIDQPKRCLYFDLTVWHFVCVFVCVWLCHGHIPIPIVIKFGINVFGTKMEHALCKVFSFPHFWKLWPFFGSIAIFERVRSTVPTATIMSTKEQNPNNKLRYF